VIPESKTWRDTPRVGTFAIIWVAIDLRPGNYAAGKLARQMETSDAAAGPFSRVSDDRRAA